ncbi:MAG: transcriptional repressor [Bacteroidales bacterium]|nr:transcriptional repressor [Bacteroidales bacterium]
MRRAVRNVKDMDSFRKLLKSKEMKATPQRIAVHGAMIALGHASADMVADHISRTGETKITVASVYNILEDLTKLGIYSLRLSSNNKRYYDITPTSHVHLYDSRGQEFRDIMDEEIVQIVKNHFKGKKFRGYKVDSIDIQLVAHPTKRIRKDN